MRRSIKIAAGISFFLVVLAVVNPALFLIPFTLAFGWIKSLGRFISVVRLSASTIAWLIVATGLLVVGTHAFCCWVQRSRSAAGRSWHWRWTCGFYAGLVLVLCASAGLVGVAHQTGWMLSSDEPVFRRRGAGFKERIRLHNVGKEVLQLALANDWDLARLKRELIGPAARSSWEEFAFYFVAASNDAPACVILLPRNPKHRTEIGIVERDTFQTRSIGTLPHLLGQTHP
jgi:hypothetical protein